MAEGDSGGDAFGDDVPLSRLTDAPFSASAQAEVRAVVSFAGCIHGGCTESVAQISADDVLIYGAGLWLASRSSIDPLPDVRIKPIVYCDPRLVDEAEPGTLLIAREFPRLVRHIVELTGGSSPPETLVAMSTFAAIEHWNPGDPLTGQSGTGKVGGGCTYHGKAAVLTAGHVTAGRATMVCAGSRGSVRFEAHAGTVAKPLQAGPDVAIVELAPGAISQPALQPVSQRASAGDALHRYRTTRVGRVHAFALFLRVQNRRGCWADVYQLDQGIGSAGDSGSPVVNGAGELVGLYLGELAGALGIVQDIGYVRGTLRATTIP